jgi:hypothetical protein
MRTDIPIDLTGIWWIRWVSDNLLIQGYNLLHLEEGLTFIGLESNTTGPHWFPAEISARTGLSHRWMFSNTVVGKVAMMVAAEKSPEGPLRLHMYNATHGRVGMYASGGYITQIDEDRWLRTNYMCSDDKLESCDHSTGICPDCSTMGNYELTRVINGDSTPHETYFPMFVKHMGSHKVRVFKEDDRCLRHCGLTTSDCDSCTPCPEV